MPVQHTNRKGQTYFLHQGVRKDGKTHYYFATKPTPEKLGEEVPEGHEIYEKPKNGQVFLRKRVSSFIDESEWELAKKLVSEYSDLPGYAIILERTQKEIIVHAAANAEDILAAQTKSTEHRRSRPNVVRHDFCGPDPQSGSNPLNDLLSKLMTVETMFLEDRAGFLTSREWVVRRDFWPAFRFELRKGGKSPKQGERNFEGYRFHYSSERWRYLREGTLEKLMRQFLPHLGKDSFFGMELS